MLRAPRAVLRHRQKQFEVDATLPNLTEIVKKTDANKNNEGNNAVDSPKTIPSHLSRILQQRFSFGDFANCQKFGRIKVQNKSARQLRRIRDNAARIGDNVMMESQVHNSGNQPYPTTGDGLDGIEAIAEFLSETLGRSWTPRQVRYAREQGSLPIRMKAAVGVYAFKSELLAALRGPDSLPQACKQ